NSMTGSRSDWLPVVVSRPSREAAGGELKGILTVFLVPGHRLLHGLVESDLGTITQLAFRLFDAEIEIEAQELQPGLRQPRRPRVAPFARLVLPRGRQNARQPERHGQPLRPWQTQTVRDRFNEMPLGNELPIGEVVDLADRLRFFQNQKDCLDEVADKD